MQINQSLAQTVKERLKLLIYPVLGFGVPFSIAFSVYYIWSRLQTASHAYEGVIIIIFFAFLILLSPIGILIGSYMAQKKIQNIHPEYKEDKKFNYKLLFLSLIPIYLINSYIVGSINIRVEGDNITGFLEVTICTLFIVFILANLITVLFAKNKFLLYILLISVAFVTLGITILGTIAGIFSLIY